MEHFSKQEQLSEILSLAELLQEPAKDYSSLIKEADKIFDNERALRANYSEPWQDYDMVEESCRADQNILKLFKKTIPGGVLCELGGAAGRMEYFAAGNNAKLYINVDKYPQGKINDFTPINPMVGEIDKKEYKTMLTGKTLIPGTHSIMQIRADMLDFVSRIKDSSVNIVINGIDEYIISVKKYHEALAQEIFRVTKKNGVIFGNRSNCLVVALKSIKNDPLLKSQYEIIKETETEIVIYKK